jgi:hypothetical protein
LGNSNLNIGEFIGEGLRRCATINIGTATAATYPLEIFATGFEEQATYVTVLPPKGVPAISANAIGFLQIGSNSSILVNITSYNGASDVFSTVDGDAIQEGCLNYAKSPGKQQQF